MSKPNEKFISIKDNEELILQMISELVLQPRINAIKWSRLTKQTPNIKIGYPGQHLASLITGMTGERTGARGNDIIDGSEVKSCSRIDQLDVCNDCKLSVARLEPNCPHCDSANVQRKDDSKWLIAIKNENDLDVLLNQVGRVLLMLGDYPNFDKQDFETLRIQTFEIWPGEVRHHRFGELMTNYYHKIYLSHKEKDSNKTPAPKNFWPYSYQFYLSNPVLTFSCTITNANSEPQITIDHLTPPDIDRNTLTSVYMPTKILKDTELVTLVSKLSQGELDSITDTAVPKSKAIRMKASGLREIIANVPEEIRSYLDLRDTDKIATAKKPYIRKVNQVN